jgi:hypothetical protein
VKDAIMHRAGKISILAALALAMMASVPALARGGGHHHHHRSSVSVGFAFGYPGYWGYPYPAYAYYPPAYYYPPSTYYSSSPPVYVERGDAYTPAERSQGYWYFCPETNTYYPYVKQCAGGWQKVSPQPQQ